MAVGVLDTLYVFNQTTRSIVKVDPLGGIIAFVGSGVYGAADGTGAAASFAEIPFMTIDATGNVFASDYASGGIRKITPAGVVTTVATGLFANEGIVMGNDDTLIVNDAGTNRIAKIAPSGSISTFAFVGGFNVGLAKGINDTLYSVDNSNHRIYKIDPLGTVTNFVGSGVSGSADGTGIAATFNAPIGIVADGVGNLFVADLGNNRIRKITPAGVVTTFAGSGTAATTDGTGTLAEFNSPWAVVISPVTGTLFISENGSSAIRALSGAVPLPLSWLSLSANLGKNGNAQIQWQVNEHSVSRYILQKSTDGRQYIAIGSIHSKGNGEQDYHYTEAQTLSGRAYYRIQQVDMDGKSTYSATLTLNNVEAKNEVLNIYPTQFGDVFNISSTTAQRALLINSLGQTVQSINIVAGVQTVSAYGLPAGLYYLKSANGSVQKLAKL
jgi:hypothetical protein